jgi:DNA-binding protein H-NS
MIQDFAQLTLDELSKVISDAQKALDERKVSERKAVLKEIHELAASIGVTVTINGERSQGRVSARKGQKVAAKYRNPINASETWTGRGVKPRWLKALIDTGKRIEDFLI